MDRPARGVTHSAPLAVPFQTSLSQATEMPFILYRSSETSCSNFRRFNMPDAAVGSEV